MAAPLRRKLLLQSFQPDLDLGLTLQNITGLFIRNTRNLSTNPVKDENTGYLIEQNDRTVDGVSQPSVSTNGRLGHFMQLYEDFVGLTEVKHAQEKVVDAEKKFLLIQEKRRSVQQDLIGVQADLRSVGSELEKTHRTDPNYINLVKKEHEVLLVETEMANKIKDLDKAERDFFSSLSTAVRESHEKERARAERTKYWSVIGSVFGALIGIIGSTWNNRMRLKEMRSIVTESGESAAHYKEIADKFISSLSSVHLEDLIRGDLSSPPKDRNQNCNLSESDSEIKSQGDFQQVIDKTDLILASIGEQTNTILSDLNDVKKILCIEKSKFDERSVVYVGPDIKQMLDETKTNMHNDTLKSLVSVSLIGCCLTVGLTLLFNFFKGS